MESSEDDCDLLVDSILAMRKYRALDLPRATIRDLIEKELTNQRTTKDILKSIRKKLHHIVAPYLGDPDYDTAFTRLKGSFAEGDAAIRAACSQILTAHVSTRERLSILEVFYRRLFDVTGKPQTILDLACGLNPFSFPWMDLPITTRYHAFDINRPRLDFINRYFSLQGLAPLAVSQDILVEPPQCEADVAFFFKEAHRFEQRERGCNVALWRALRVQYLLVSLPVKSLSGKHDLSNYHRHLVEVTVKGTNWQVTQVDFENELVFCIDKGRG